MQRWISNMKPRKFLGGRSKPDGGGGEALPSRDLSDLYFLKPNKLNNLLQKKYSNRYRINLIKQLATQNRIQKLYVILSFVIALVAVILLLGYLAKIFELF